MACRVLCDAVAFGYGPAAKLITLLNHLRHKDLELILIANGASEELLAATQLRSFYSVDTGDPASLQCKRELFASADLFVNVMNPVSLRFAQELNVRCAVVDSLFWMWASVDPGMAKSEVYFIQRFVGVEDRLRREQDKIRNPVLVGPIVDDCVIRDKSHTQNQLLVNFGGLQSALIRRGENLRYPYIVGRLLEKSLQGHGFDRVLVTGATDVMKDLDASLRVDRAEFVSLGHFGFLQELAASRLLLTSPGLTACYEAFFYGTPVAFLPPQNYSQYFNLLSLRKAGVAQHSIHWQDLLTEHPLVLGAPEEQGVRAVENMISRFEEDTLAQGAFVDMVRDFLRLDGRLGMIVQSQQDFISRMGSNGAATIAGYIKNLLGVSQG